MTPPIEPRNTAPWQAFVPMGGSGQRFRDAGYDLPKPLIDVDGRPMIAHVVSPDAA